MQPDIRDFLYKAWPRPVGPTEAAKAVGIKYPTAWLQMKRLRNKHEIVKKGRGYVLSEGTLLRLTAFKKFSEGVTSFSAPEAAAVLRMPVQSLTRMIRKGDVKADPVSGAGRVVYRVPRNEVERLRSQISP